uniref:CASP-like protein n=1 Tax=Setaria italica TaxID=4555 RepID=K3ZK07_SETIT
MAGGKSDGSPDAASLALRIATVALSVASAAMMASASQRSCAGCAPASQPVSYSDYSSLNIVSAALQAAAACLKARGKEGESKAAKSLAELVDTAAQVLLYSSSALAFSVDDFGTCGHRVAGVCKGSGEFCQRVRASGAVSMAAAVALAASKYLNDVPVSTWFKGDEKKAKQGCGRGCHCHH